MQDKNKLVIIGAGVTGLTLAERLCRYGKYDIKIVEKSGHIGGLAATVCRNDILFDLGSHRLHKKIPRKIMVEIERVVCGSLLKRRRSGRMYFRGRFLTYPPDILTILRVLPFYNELYKGYIKKLWGVGSDGSLMKKAKRRKVFLNLSVGRHSIGRDYYFYPKNGIGEISCKLAENIESCGGELINSSKVSSVCLENNRISGLDIEGHDGSRRHISCDVLVSTAPIDDTHSMVFGASREGSRLKWRGLVLINMHLDAEIAAENETYYFPESDIMIGRVSFINKYSPFINASIKGSVLTVEIPSFPGDGIWSLSDAELLDKSLKDMARVGILKDNSKVLNYFTLKLDKVYPVYNKGWDERFAGLYRDIDRIANMFAVGRMGLFLHCNIDHCMTQAAELADFILNKECDKDNGWNKKAAGFFDFTARD